MNRDNVARLTISPPLEAHKSHTICYSVFGVDCGFDNPIFAAIELDYSEADLDSTGQATSEAQKNLTFYELDWGLIMCLEDGLSRLIMVLICLLW